MSALVAAFVMGLGISFFESTYLKKAFDEFRDIIAKTIEVALIPILPIYIFSIFLNMSYSGQAWRIIQVFVAIIGVIFVMHILLLVFQYCIAGAVAHRNPFKALYNMLPAYFTALGTSSSAATIPVTLNQVKRNGVSDGIAGFVVPLCATIHLSGSAMKITACAVALMLMQGMAISLGQFTGFILMLGSSENRERYCFVVSADRFLRNMVRAMVGSLLEVGQGKRPVEWIQQMLKEQDRSAAGMSVPGNPLFLTNIKYPYKIK